MRYEELPGPLEGWTYDEQGVIYTASGYKTTARQIEFAMWMYECMTEEAKQWMIRSDEHPGALRPIYERSDLYSESAGRGIMGTDEPKTLGKQPARPVQAPRSKDKQPAPFGHKQNQPPPA